MEIDPTPLMWSNFYGPMESLEGDLIRTSTTVSAQSDYFDTQGANNRTNNSVLS